jgi:hypothetical protein
MCKHAHDRGLSTQRPAVEHAHVGRERALEAAGQRRQQAEAEVERLRTRRWWQRRRLALYSIRHDLFVRDDIVGVKPVLEQTHLGLEILDSIKQSLDAIRRD